MGAGSSTEVTTREFYKKYVGGAEVFGGLEEIGTYKGGAMSSAKKALIRDIAELINDDLKLTKSGNVKNIKDLPIDRILDALREIIPDNKKIKFVDKKDTQEKKCRTLAKAINKVFPGSITGESSDEICKQVAEYMFSLTSSVGDEIAVAQKDINRVLKNLRETGQFIESNYRKIVEVLNKSEDYAVRAEANRVAKFHQDLLDEHNRQIKLLQTMLGDIVQPSVEELSRILQESDDYVSLVRKIGKPGTAEFAEKMAYVLQGIRNTAEAANLVDKALKDVGVSYAKYKTAKDFSELKELLNSTILNVSDMDEVAVKKYLQGVEILEKYQYLHDEIVEELKKKVGKGESVKGGINYDKRVKARKQTRTALIKAFNARLHDLLKQILADAEGIAKAVSSGNVPLGDDLRKFIKMLNLLPSLHSRPIYFSITGYYSDIRSKQARESFVNQMEHVINSAKKLLKTKGGEYFKNLIKTLEQIITLIDTYVDKFAQGFGPMESWEDYKKKMKGGDEHEDDNMDTDEESLEYEVTEDEWERNIESLVNGGEVDIVKVTTLANTLDQAINAIYYQYKAATIKENLSRIAPELESYGEDYYKILGDAIAKELDDIQEFENKENEKFKEVKVDNEQECKIENKTEKSGLYYRAYTSIASGDTDFVKRVKAPSDTELKERKKELKEIQTYLKTLLDSKRDLVRCAEAIDTYLMEFTNALTSNPGDLQDILSILDSTEVISKWFSSDSGDSLCKVFECFPGYKIQDANNNKPGYEHLGDNILRFNQDNGGNSDPGLYNINYYSGLGNAEYEIHYYEKVARFCGFGAHNNNATFAGKTYGEDVGTPIKDLNMSLPGNPFLSSPIYRSKAKGRTVLDALDNAKDAMKIGVIKNLISAFVTIGGEFGGTRLIKKTNMSPKQIYTILNNYIACSAFGFGFKACKHGIFEYSNIPYDLSSVTGLRMGRRARSSIDEDKNPSVPATTETFTQSTAGNNILTLGKFNRYLSPFDTFDEALMRGAGRLSTGNKNYSNERSAKHPSGMSQLNKEEIEKGANYGGSKIRKMDFIKDPFEKTDEIFVMIIKSITAKILTSVGAYNLLNRPMDVNALGYSSALRLTMGGAEMPKIIPEAIDLYIRLPLLAEFYRSIFNFEDGSGPYRKEYNRMGDVNYNISMIPEMDGVFSGLIYIIFDRARYVENGAYSTNEASALIEEINKIYMIYRKTDNPTTEVIHEFIAEVNRRYGIVKNEERKAYLKERSKRYTTSYESPEQLIDFDLEAIDEDDTYRRPAPSDAYRQTFKDTNSGSQKHKHKIDFDHRQDIQILRHKIDTLFNEATDALMSGESQNVVSKMNRLKVYTFENLINARRLELESESDPRKQFDIVMNSINNLSSFAINTLERSYILFHETVVVGLNTLHSLQQQLLEFFKKIAELDLAIKEDEKVINGGARNADNNEYYDAYFGDRSVSRNKVFITLIESLFTFSSLDDLTRVNIESTNKGDLFITVEYGELKEKIYSIFNKVKSQLDTFRGILPESVIKKYEEYDPSKNSSTFYSIEKHLLNELIEGRWEKRFDGRELSDRLKEDSLDKVTTKINKILEFVTRKGAYAEDNNDPVNNILQIYLHLGLNELIIPDGENYDTRGRIEIVRFGAGLKSVQNMKGEKKYIFEPEGNKPSQGILLINNELRKEITMGREEEHRRNLIHLFNQTLYSYLDACFDEPTNKMYITCIDDFANGVFNGSIHNEDQQFDDREVILNNIFMNFNNINGVLYTGLARLIRALVGFRTINNDDYLFLESDISEIPRYVKESYEANLPVFRKMFKLISMKADMIRKFSRGVESDTLILEKSDFICGEIIRGCSSIIKCIDNTSEDLFSEPVFGDLYKGFCKDYESTTGEVPLTLFSNLLHLLTPKEGEEVSLGLPIYSSGVMHKYMYSIREFEKFSIDSAPGIKSLIKGHNDRVDKEFNFEIKDISSYYNDLIHIIKYITDTYNYNDRLSMYTLDINVERVNYMPTYYKSESTHSVLLNVWGLFNINSNNYTSTNSVVIMIENPSQKIERAKLITQVSAKDEHINMTRRQMLAFNIIDMNVVPINVHALMREIPLVNLYNYSYTFDKMIKDIFNVSTDTFTDNYYDAVYGEEIDLDVYSTDKYNRSLEINKRTSDVLAELLLYPYRHMTERAYEHYISKIMKGATGVEGLGKPKYLAEEVYNKALFGEVYGENILTWLYDSPSEIPGEERVVHEYSAGELVLNGKLAQKKRKAPHRDDDGDIVSETNITYYNTENREVSIVDLSVGADSVREILKCYGKLRFDTRLVRNILFATNINRVLRVQLKRNLTFHNSRVVKEYALLASSNTELYGHDINKDPVEYEYEY